MVQRKHVLSVLIVTVALVGADQGRKEALPQFAGRGGRYAIGQGQWKGPGSNGENHGWTNSQGGGEGGGSLVGQEVINEEMRNGGGVINESANEVSADVPTVVYADSSERMGDVGVENALNYAFPDQMPVSTDGQGNELTNDWVHNEWNGGVMPIQSNTQTGPRTELVGSWPFNRMMMNSEGGRMNGGSNRAPSNSAPPNGQMVGMIGWNTGSGNSNNWNGEMVQNSGVNDGWWPSNDWYYARGNMDNSQRMMNGVPQNDENRGNMEGMNNGPWNRPRMTTNSAGRWDVADRVNSEINEANSAGQNDGWWPSNDWYQNRAMKVNQWTGNRDGGNRYPNRSWW